MQSAISPDTARHTVRVTAQRTGLTPHTLRAWERRYQVVAPGRSEGGQRLYSDLDIQRLSLLRRLTERGHSIARLAEVSQEDLERTAREDSGSKSPEPKPLGDDFGAKDFSAAALNATRRLDAAELHAVLERASITLGVPVFLDQVVVPTLRGIGQGWSEGTVSIAHEHLASGVIRRVLGWILRVYEITESAPRLVVATPPRQAHEMGAMLAGAAAAAEGWDVTYLGADLPIPEILASAGQVGANGVALSIVYPAIDPGLVSDLELLRGGLGSRIPLIVGGYAASQDRDRLTSIGVQVVDSLDQFRESLDDLRDRV